MVEFRNVTKSFDKRQVLDNVNLVLEQGKFTMLTGESGRGKTTLLRIAAGLEKADGGEFISDERVAVMFQEPRLLPWKNARDNIRAVLAKEHFPLADKYLSAVGLSEDGDKYPHELSGGMAQRVALARFLAFSYATDATLLLLDEPFSALDDSTAEKMLILLREHPKGKTVLMVTHRSSDAEFADKIITL